MNRRRLLIFLVSTALLTSSTVYAEEVHIKPKRNEIVTYDDLVKTIIAANITNHINMHSIFENNTLSSVHNLLDLPSTTISDIQFPGTDGDIISNDKVNITTTNDNSKLQFGSWIEVPQGTFGNKYNETHSWAIEMGIRSSTNKDWSKHSNQRKYMYSENMRTDEYGYYIYTVDGVDYYSIALPAYFVCETITPNSPNWDINKWNDSVGRSCQIKLEDGSIVNCLLGDTKSCSDTNMDEQYLGHVDNGSLCIVETIHGETTVWNANGPAPHTNAGAKHHKGSPWTSNPIAIRMGPKLPV